MRNEPPNPRAFPCVAGYRAPAPVLDAIATRSRRLAEQFRAAARERPARPPAAITARRRALPLLHWVMLAMCVTAAIRQLQA